MRDLVPILDFVARHDELSVAECAAIIGALSASILRQRVDGPQGAARPSTISGHGGPAPESPQGVRPAMPLKEAVDQFQKRYIAEVLALFGGNRTHAAAALEVNVRTIFRSLENQDE